MKKTEKELRLNSSSYNQATEKTMGNHEIWNSAANWQRINELFDSEMGFDVKNEPKKNRQPVIITGSGPSLDNTIDMLKEWDGGIICHYSQAVSLAYKGIEPDYIMALDALCNWEGLKDIDWSKTKTKLISHPGVYPSLIENWPNEILFYRQNLGKRDSFQKSAQRVMYSKKLETLEEALAGTIKLETMIRTEITMFACTPPAQLIAAQILEYGPVFLTGLDFCYLDDKLRFTNYEKSDCHGCGGSGERMDVWKENSYDCLDCSGTGKIWKGCAYPSPEDTSAFVLTDNGHLTERLHLYYKKNFMSALRLTMQQCYTTDKGAVNEIPYYPMSEVIAKQGRGFKVVRREESARNLERYLASVGCYVIDYLHGNGFVESTSIDQLVNYMRNQNRQYSCEACGKEAVSNDGEDHTGRKCEVCGGKMKVTNFIDIEKNRKRIQKLMDYCEVKK